MDSVWLCCGRLGDVQLGAKRKLESVQIVAFSWFVWGDNRSC